MAPPPEYDKEPKAPDKSATVLPGDDLKSLHNLLIDHQNNSDSKTANATANIEVENNKHVEHLDDGQLKALLDEAITYKRPKDREGKSSLFNELLEEVEQDEQALEAAARELSGGRAARRAPRGGRRALAHSNSLQDLEQEALAAECALRRVRPAPASVSARAHHGGSLPCDVDKSFLLGDESSGRGGYLATVRCVNPPPLNERRVSASDAHDHEPGARRSKPAFPMTYTARATLEIGSGSVGSGRAVTTTTASNQVRMPPRPPRPPPRRPRRPAATSPHWTPLTTGPPARLYADRLYDPYREADYFCYKKHKVSHSDAEKRKDNLDEPSEFKEISTPKKIIALPTVKEEIDSNQRKLLNALVPKTNRGGGNEESNVDVSSNSKVKKPRGSKKKKTQNAGKNNVQNQSPRIGTNAMNSDDSNFWINKVNSWYEGLGTYSSQTPNSTQTSTLQKGNITNVLPPDKDCQKDLSNLRNPSQCDASCAKANDSVLKPPELPSTSDGSIKAESHMQRKPKKDKVIKELIKDAIHSKHNQNCAKYEQYTDFREEDEHNDEDSSLIRSRLKYRERVGSLVAPKVTCFNPKNVRGMTIGSTPVLKGLVLSMSDAEKDKSVCNAFCADEEKLQSKKFNKQSSFVSESSNKKKYDSDTRLNPQHIKSAVTESYYDKKLTLKMSEANQSKVFADSIRTDSTNENTMNLSSCEEIHEDIVLSISDHSEEYSNKGKTQHTKVSDDLGMPIRHESISCSNTENNAVHIELKGLSDLDLPEKEKKSDLMLEIASERKTQDVAVQDYNIIDLDIAKDHKSISCSNTGNIFLSMELQEFCDSGLLISEEKATDRLEIKSERNAQDMTVQNSAKELDHSDFETHLNTQIKNMNEEEDNEIERLAEVICSSKLYIDEEEGVELMEIKSRNDQKNNASFSKYLDDQQKLFQAIGGNDNDLEYIIDSSSFNNMSGDKNIPKKNKTLSNSKDGHELRPVKGADNLLDDNSFKLVKKEDKANYVLGVIPNNSYVFLTFPKSLTIPFNKSLHDVETTSALTENITGRSRKKKKKSAPGSIDTNKRVFSREELKTLLFQNLMKSESDDKSVRLKTTSAAHGRQVDSAIPFNCITSSEVVDTCSTTTSTQPSVAEDTKPLQPMQPLQLGWGYRAVASLTGAPPAAPRAPLAAAPPPRAPPAPPAPDSAQPRSVISSSFNGLPLARTSYGSTATTASSDEYKKSLDENGNSLQGFSSPQSGSSHNKKPRRKKSSKNETVITSHQIDGYKGDKDLNEVLRFIESRAEQGRAHKLGRAKHKDDADDKAGKKRSAERRKDKEAKPQRASSLEELSRTTLEELTAAPEPQRRAAPAKPAKPAKPERRSWGDDARDAFCFRDDAAASDAPPDADFQTVTKKRKPRRRADEPEPEPPRPQRAPTPRARRVSAPPSDRSADSNDDMDSVHSLPAEAPRLAAPAPAPVSYADIARTRHNIPDLIESCNFYAEGEAREAAAAAAGEARARGDADYPALEPRPAARRARDLPAKSPATALPPLTRDRKEAREVTRVPELAAGAAGVAGAGAPAAAASPAPDVVADRRPPVILLDSAARPGDMDGVTFGFDINEQLLGGSTRRPRCDLVRDAVESKSASDVTEAEPLNLSPETAPTVDAAVTKPVEGAVKSAVEAAVAAVKPGAEAGGVAVAAGCGALRWLPPHPPRDTHQLLQIVDFVGAAWEDVVRCGGGKVRYFSE